MCSDWAKCVWQLTFLLHRHDKFIVSPAGQELEKRLYNETMAEMGKFIAVPSYLARKA